MTKHKVGAGEPSKRVRRLAELVRRETKALLGPNATFEQRADAAAELMAAALAKGVYEGEQEDQARGRKPQGR